MSNRKPIANINQKRDELFGMLDQADHCLYSLESNEWLARLEEAVEEFNNIQHTGFNPVGSINAWLKRNAKNGKKS